MIYAPFTKTPGAKPQLNYTSETRSATAGYTSALALIDLVKSIDEKIFSDEPRPKRVCPVPRQPNNAMISTQKTFL